MRPLSLVLSSLSLCLLEALAPAQWTTGTLSAPRRRLTATCSGGVVLFAGGESGTGGVVDSDRVDLYDLSTGTWSTATLSQSRTSLASASLPGLAFFAGGMGAAGNPECDRVDVYHESTGTWSTASLSVGRWRLAGTAVDSAGLVFFAGGYESVPGGATASDVVDVHDASAGSWSTASLSIPRVDLAAASVGTKAFFAGGVASSHVPTAVVDVFDSATGSWSTATLSEARSQIGATTIGSKVLFAGGTVMSNPFTASATVDVYDDVTGEWSVMSLPAPRSLHAAAATPYRAVFACGADSVNPGALSNTADVWDAATGTWSVVTLAGGPRTFPAAASGCFELLVGGGWGPAAHDSDAVDLFLDLRDCNQNGVPDCADLAQGTSTDCDGDDVPDDCQLALDPRLDWNQNGVFDACECQVASLCTAVPHSGGSAASISWWGSPSISVNSFHLRVTGALPDTPGLFFYAAQPNQVPWGDGFLCLKGPHFRLHPMTATDSDGVAELRLDFDLPPANAGAGLIDLFSSWRFQYWYPDPSGATGFNSSDGLQVTFCP